MPPFSSMAPKWVPLAVPRRDEGEPVLLCVHPLKILGGMGTDEAEGGEELDGVGFVPGV